MSHHDASPRRQQRAHGAVPGMAEKSVFFQPGICWHFATGVTGRRPAELRLISYHGPLRIPEYGAEMMAANQTISPKTRRFLSADALFSMLRQPPPSHQTMGKVFVGGFPVCSRSNRLTSIRTATAEALSSAPGVLKTVS